jgi:hypothetical protein
MKLFFWIIVVVILTVIFGTWVLEWLAVALEWLAGLLRAVASAVDWFGSG